MEVLLIFVISDEASPVVGHILVAIFHTPGHVHVVVYGDENLFIEGWWRFLY